MWLPVGGANLEKSFIFWKQLRLKTTDTFPVMYTNNIDNMCNTHWRIGVRKVSNTKVTPRSLKVIDIGAIWQDKYDFPLVFHCNYNYNMPSVLWHCWLGGKKGIQPVKNWAVGAGMVICLEWGADLHMAQQKPLTLTVSCFSKIQNGFTFLVPAHPGIPGQRAVKRVCVCVCNYISIMYHFWANSTYFPKF